MNIQTLGEKERKLLLRALDFNYNTLRCQYCSKSVRYNNYGIMHPVNTKRKATIICDSPLCMSAYLEEIKEKKI